MTNRFLISVAAAALIAGTGFANAQGTGTGREARIRRGSAGAAERASSERGGAVRRRDDRDSGGTPGAEGRRIRADARAQSGMKAD